MSERPRPVADAGPATTIGRLDAGDCLDVLRARADELAGRVDLVLTDPPYNTGGDFTYHDDYGGDERWLDMVGRRLAAARDCLRSDGALVVHIDEHQHHRLRGLLERLFGAGNDLGEIIWDKLNPKGDAGHVACQHETLLVFARDRRVFTANRRLRRVKPNAARMLSKARELTSRIGARRIPDDLAAVAARYALPIDPSAYCRTYGLEDARSDYQEWLRRQGFGGGEQAYRHLDDEGRVYRTVSMAWPNKRRPPDDYFVPLRHPRTGRPCPVPLRGWRNPPATMARLLAQGEIVFGPDETRQPERKYYLDEHAHENLPSVLRYGASDDALLRALGIPFDNPKPVALSRLLIEAFVEDGGRVLDPFAGSGTIGHACLDIAAQGVPMRFDLMQSLEPLDPDRPGQREAAAFCERLGVPPLLAFVTRERLRRVAAGLRMADGTRAGIAEAGFPPEEPRPDQRAGGKTAGRGRSSSPLADPVGSSP